MPLDGTMMPHSWPGLVRPPLPAVVVALVGILGGALSLLRFAAGLPLRTDEIRLALNIFERDWAGLLLPLDHGQAAPVGFLWMAKAAVRLFGRSEYALRLVPLAAALASIPLTIRIARRLLPPFGVAAAVFLLCLAPQQLVRAADFKQYTVDTVCALAVLWTALPLVEGAGAPSQRVRLALAGALAMLVSHVALVVLAGTGLVVAARAAAARRVRPAIETTLVGLVWIAVFAGLYTVSLRALTASAYLLDFWAGAFAPAPTSWTAATWYPRAWLEYLNAPGFGRNPLVAVLWCAGAWRLWRSRRWLLALLVAPAAAALLASAARLYPFADRLLYGLGPAVAIVAAFGAVDLRDRVAPGRRAAATLAAALVLFVTGLPYSGLGNRWIGGRFDVRHVLPAVAEAFRPGDALILGEQLNYVYNYYRGPDLPRRDATMVMPRREGDEHARALAAALAGHARVWLLVGHNIWQPDGPPIFPLEPTLRSLERMGRVTARIDGANLTAVLVEPAPGPVRRAPGWPPADSLAQVWGHALTGRRAGGTVSRHE